MASKFGKFLKRAGKNLGRAIKRDKKALLVLGGVTWLTALAVSSSKKAHREASIKSQPIRRRITTARYNALIAQGNTPETITASYSSSPGVFSPSGQVKSGLPVTLILVVIGIVVVFFIAKK